MNAAAHGDRAGETQESFQDLAAAGLLAPSDTHGLAKLRMALRGSAFRVLAQTPMAVMGKAVSVGGLACGDGPVMPMAVNGGLARVFVRRGRATVMRRVTVMDRLPVTGGVTMRSGRRSGVMPMRAGYSAASRRMVVTVMRRSGLRLGRGIGVMEVMMMRDGGRWRGADKGQQHR